MKPSNPAMASSTTGASQEKKKRPQKKKNKTKSKAKSIPVKGDPDYLTPTQLRNRRKRRAKQQKNNSSCSNGLEVGRSKGDGDAKEPDSSYRNKTKSKDPSMMYISNPRNAPIVQAAKQYFRSIQNQKSNLCSAIDFQVHLGPLYGWRTVSKLAVRPASSPPNNEKPRVAIGLFIPNSHTLLPVPNCRAHHESINQVVDCVTKACHKVGIAPYQEASETDSNASGESAGDKGKGQLRYICVNIERKTGGAQLTLVWNGDAPNCDAVEVKRNEVQDNIRGVSDPHLAKLVTKILSMSNSATGFSISGSLADIQKTREETICNDISISPGIDPPAKRRRRRGNREGNSSVKENNDVGTPNENKDSIDADNIPPDTFNRNEKSSTQQPKFNLHSLWINYNLSWKHSNAILAYDSSCWKHVHGPPAIVEHIDFEESSSDGRDSYAHPAPPSYPIPLHFPPNVFRQANLDAFTNIVARIRERVLELGKSLEADSSTTKVTQKNNLLPSCIELYGGVGTIGLYISDIVSSLVSSDENPNNSKCFNDSVKTFPLDVQPRLEYKQKNAKDMIITESSLFQKCQVLIVDPPRKGLDKEVVDYLCTTGWQTLKLVVYISCGFQAFQQDCNAILGSERWKLDFAEAYLLFPGSHAIETLAMFVPVL